MEGRAQRCGGGVGAEDPNFLRDSLLIAGPPAMKAKGRLVSVWMGHVFIPVLPRQERVPERPDQLV